MKWTPWVIAVSAILMCIALAARVQRLERERNALQERLVQATALISREPRVGSLPSPEGESAVPEPIAGEEPSAEMYIEQPFATDSFENQTSALEAAVQKTEGERYAAFADQLTAAQYAPMFETLGLEPERHERVHQAIAAGIMERLRLEGENEAKDRTVGERIRVYAAASAAIDGELQSILSQQELAIWQEFEATFEQRQMETGIGVTLVRSQSLLSPENRDSVAAVFTEQFFDAREVYAEEPFNGSTVFDMMTYAADRTHERLYDEFDDEQMSYLAEFLEQFLAGLRPEVQDSDSPEQKSVA